MKRRIIFLIACGSVGLTAGYYGFTPLFRFWFKPHDIVSRGYPDSSPLLRHDGLAPVAIWREASPERPGYWHASKAAKLNLTAGSIFVGDELLPMEEITNYLDARVKMGEIDYVVIFPDRKAKWMDIFPIIDKCRKSTVKIVLLNAPGAQPRYPGWIE
jgi:hypothetical protein